jgi:hypothetical protein
MFGCILYFCRYQLLKKQINDAAMIWWHQEILDPLFQLIMLRIQLRTLSKISTAYLLSQVMQ